MSPAAISPSIPQRKYFYVPIAIQDSITQDELDELTKIAGHKFDKIVKLFADVIFGKCTHNLTSNQLDTIREIHRQVQEKHNAPNFDSPDCVVSLPIHYQCLPTTDRSIVKHLNKSVDALLLKDNTNAEFQFFLNIANPVPHGDRISLPLAINKTSCQHLVDYGSDKGFTADALMLELGPSTAGVRMVVSKKKPAPMPLDKITHLLTRDYGYRNTVTLSLIELDEPLDLTKLEEIQAFTKEEAKKYLSTHAIENMPKIIGIARFSGLAFLKRIYQQTLKIDKLKSQIDKEYAVLENERLLIAIAFGLQEGDRIHKAMAPKGHPCYRIVASFFIRFARIREMKALRRKKYQSIASLKKSWFGFLANLEVGLAKTSDAAVIREDLTNVTEEHDSPTYKGRVFNKMINAGSRGQYAKRASGKFKWNGIPEFALPSYYTSTTCFVHGIVDKKQRKGDVFACKRCMSEGRGQEHADEHAALTLAVYPFLQIKSLPRDTQAA